MTERNRVIGVDPGPTPGVVVLDLEATETGVRVGDVQVVQCSAGVLDLVLWALVADLAGKPYRMQVERFVARGRSNASQSLTRDQVGWILREHHAVQRSAAQVKPWATDARLDAVASGPGLLKDLAGMRHARDAARHALFAAVHDAGLPDPLSKEYRR